MKLYYDGYIPIWIVKSGWDWSGIWWNAFHSILSNTPIYLFSSHQ